jgi:hypothetical protein
MCLKYVFLGIAAFVEGQNKHGICTMSDLRWFVSCMIQADRELVVSKQLSPRELLVHT